MTSRLQLACAWCGPVFAVVFFAGALVAGLVPPPSPGRSAEQVAAFYADNTDRIRLGVLIMLVAGGLTAPFVAVISIQMRRMAGPASPMPHLQLIGGTLGVVAVLVPMWMFLAAAFQPTRDPQITQALNDLAFLPFVGNFVPAVVQCVAVGVAVLADERDTPILPRWVGYYNLWTAFMFLPGGLVVYFKQGAFGWNGAVNFWIVAALFGVWFIVMSHVLRQAIRTQRADEQPAPSSRPAAQDLAATPA